LVVICVFFFFFLVEEGAGEEEEDECEEEEEDECEEDEDEVECEYVRESIVRTGDGCGSDDGEQKRCDQDRDGWVD
jgi:hypothetical protein